MGYQMKTNRVVRVILGLIVLILFGVYCYIRASYTPFSDDIGAPPKPAQTAPPAETAAPENSGEAAPEGTEETPAVEATPEPTVDPNSPEGRALAAGLPAPPDIDINSWEYILVSKAHEIGEYAPPEVVKVSSSGCPQDSRIAEALQSFADGCEAAGLPVYLSSGYRTYNEQYQNFQRKLNEGLSREVAATIVNPPGASEHQTGLCCDITDIYRNPKTQDLENTETFQWLYAHCAEYGFILRYPKGEEAEAITENIYEPWHFRYVGTEAAAYIMENNLTLEEFWYLYNGEPVPGSSRFGG